MINITRPGPVPEYTEIIYYIERFGNSTPASIVVAVINQFEDQEIAIHFGYPVIIKGEGEHLYIYLFRRKTRVNFKVIYVYMILCENKRTGFIQMG